MSVYIEDVDAVCELYPTAVEAHFCNPNGGKKETDELYNYLVQISEQERGARMRELYTYCQKGRTVRSRDSPWGWAFTFTEGIVSTIRMLERIYRFPLCVLVRPNYVKDKPGP